MSDLHPPEAQINGGGGPPPPAVPPSDNLGTKRHRRPSVRLGDIGDQPYDSHATNRRTKQWKLPTKDSHSNKGSKTRTLMNLGGGDHYETLDVDDREGNLDTVAIGSWRVKDSKFKRGSTKRVRSNWASKVDEEPEEDDDDDDNGFVVFEDFNSKGGSESPMKEQSPIHSLDNNNNTRGVAVTTTRARVSEGRESDTDTRNWNNAERNGVRVWLNQLGLGRYAPVFEIHEVDDEVLPLLTLEDLKDMGINAVGSRRKMYCAIQKLSKGFS